MKETQTLRFFIFILLFTSLENSFSQCATLQFAELGSEPARCRTASYQSGNGVVYAAATGGTPDYTYQWTNMYNGSTTSNTTLGGVNPGEYQIKITDDIGCVITAIVKVDSISPNADFELGWIDSSSSIPGSFSAEVIFTNTSDDIYNLIWPDPFADEPNYFWNSGGDSTWTPAFFDENYSVNLNGPGFFEVCLVAMNYNFCTDTICKSISLSEPVFEDDAAEVYYSSTTGEVSIELLLSYPVDFDLYDLNGGTSISMVLVPGTNNFVLDPGIYAYNISNSITWELICSGTIAIY